MRLFRFLRNRPVAVFGVCACAFGVWVGREALRTPKPPLLVLEASEGAGQLAERPWPDGPPTRFKVIHPPPVEVRANPQATAQALPKLKPGMTRTEVEGLVGAPAPANIHPATARDGRVTYSTAYEADFEPPATVRPLRRPLPNRPAEPGGADRARTLVTLEFDATKPGHPLLEVHYPDPLF